MPRKTKAQLEAEMAEMTTAYEALHKKFTDMVVGGVRLKHAGPSADGKGFELTLTDARGIVQLMADAMVKVFDADGGINYTEYVMRHIEKNEDFILSIQRANGKRPSAMQKKAETDRRLVLVAASRLREAQKAYLTDRGNEALGQAVAKAAEDLDNVMAGMPF